MRSAAIRETFIPLNLAENCRETMINQASDCFRTHPNLVNKKATQTYLRGLSSIL